MLQGGHVRDDLSVGEHWHFPVQGVHGMNPPASLCHRPDLVVQIIHCGPRDLSSDADSVVRLPRARYCGDDTDPVQASVDAVDKVRAIPGQRELWIPGAQILLRRPGNDPRQLVPLDMRHSHLHRAKPKRKLPLVLAFQLFLDDLNRGFSLNHSVSIPYGLAGYHQVSYSLSHGAPQGALPSAGGPIALSAPERHPPGDAGLTRATRRRRDRLAREHHTVQCADLGGLQDSRPVGQARRRHAGRLVASSTC